MKVQAQKYLAYQRRDVEVECCIIKLPNSMHNMLHRWPDLHLESLQVTYALLISRTIGIRINAFGGNKIHYVPNPR